MVRRVRLEDCGWPCQGKRATHKRGLVLRTARMIEQCHFRRTGQILPERIPDGLPQRVSAYQVDEQRPNKIFRRRVFTLPQGTPVRAANSFELSRINGMNKPPSSLVCPEQQS